MNQDKEMEREESRKNWKDWFIVCTLAILFLIYGVFMYFIVGDKGPPDWNFGNVEDIPGQSVYSTNPAGQGPAAVPEPQHVSQKPPLVEPGAPKEKP
jgi:hypothetical protein